MSRFGTTLLTTRGKDLRVAGWMGVASVKLQGWTGLAGALVTYDGLARNFWDTMYPDAKRARGRVNAFMWLADQAVKYCQGLDVAMADGDAVRTSNDVLKELDQLLVDKLGDAYPGPGMLRSMLRDKVNAIPAAPPPEAPKPAEPPPVAAPVAAAAVAEAPAAAAVAAPNAADIDGSVRDYGRALVDAASIMRSADITRPLAYRILRLGAWLLVQNPPPADGERTRSAPPQTRSRSAWRRSATSRTGSIC